MHFAYALVAAISVAQVIPQTQPNALLFKVKLKRLRLDESGDDILQLLNGVNKAVNGEGIGATTSLAIPFKMTTNKYAYFLELGLGNPNQTYSFMVDSGSADFWVDAGRTQVSDWTPTPNHRLSIQYADKSHINGTFGHGDIYLESGQIVENVTYARADDIALASGQTFDGFLGIARRELEAGPVKYPNFVDDLQERGLIHTRGYSYNFDENGGNIVFGGYDKAKIDGPLQKFNLVSEGRLRPFDTIEVPTITGIDGNQLHNQQFITDTGTTLNWMRRKDIEFVFGKIPGYTTSTGGIFAFCNQSTTDFISFDFGEVSIKFSYQDLVVTTDILDGAKFCSLTWQPVALANSTCILGQQFLKNAYVLVNHDTKTFGIANIKQSNNEDIVAF